MVDFWAAGEATGPLLPLIATLGLMAVIWIPAVVYFVVKNPKATRPNATMPEPLRTMRNAEPARRRRAQQPRTPQEASMAKTRSRTARQESPAPEVAWSELPTRPNWLPTQRRSSGMPSNLETGADPTR